MSRALLVAVEYHISNEAMGSFKIQCTICEEEGSISQLGEGTEEKVIWKTVAYSK